MRRIRTKRAGIALLRIATSVTLLALAVAIAFGFITASSGGVAVVVALLAVLALIVTRADARELLRRVRKVGAWGVTLDLAAEAEEAARSAQGAESGEELPEGAQDDAEGEERPDIIDLRLRLENKLVYIGKHLLPDGSSQFSTIGSLRAQRLLTKAQARTAARVLSFSNMDLETLPPTERDAFLKDASIVVGNIRGIVFSSVVRKTLSGAGWQIERIRRRGKLPDYLATKDGRRVRVAPAFSVVRESPILESAKSRVQEREPQVERRIVVIPDVSPYPTSAGGEPVVLKFSDLPRILQS